MLFAARYLENIRKSEIESQQTLNTLMIVYEFTSAIVMRKNRAVREGTDKTIELNSLKLLARTRYWSCNMEMLGMKQCHIEYKRGFLRLLTLILNWNSCGIFILRKLTDFKNNKDHKKQLDHLIALCEDAEDSVE